MVEHWSVIAWDDVWVFLTFHLRAGKVHGQVNENAYIHKYQRLILPVLSGNTEQFITRMKNTIPYRLEHELCQFSDKVWRKFTCQLRVLKP